MECHNSAMKKRVGILGGTFNPVHIGHLLLAESAVEAFGLSHVLLMPCAVPPHKAADPLAAAEHRVAMLERAVEGVAELGICRLELERGGTSFAVDTLRAFRERFPEADPWFLIGMDSLLDLHQWRDVATLLTLCTFATLERPGYDHRPAAGDLNLPTPWPEQLLSHIAPGRRVDVSSSEIRSRIAQRRSIRYLVPRSVEAYIMEQGLYRRGDTRPVTEENDD